MRIAAGLAYIPPRREELAKARGEATDCVDRSAKPFAVDDVVIAEGQRGIVERHPCASDPVDLQNCLLVRFRSGAHWVKCAKLQLAPSSARRTDDGTYPDADDARAKVASRTAAGERPDFAALVEKLLADEHRSGVMVGRAAAFEAVQRVLTVMIARADIDGDRAESKTLHNARRQVDRLARGEVSK